jgi:hypothetical protein
MVIRNQNNQTFKNNKVGTENMSVTVRNDNSSRIIQFKSDNTVNTNTLSHIMTYSLNLENVSHNHTIVLFLT